MSTQKYQIKYFFQIRWLRIFYHDYSTSEAFDDLEEAKHTNSQYKFSILDEIDESYKIGGKYEFLLNYTVENSSNWWRQNNFPLYENITNNESYVEGYEPIMISWNESWWGGMQRTPFHEKYGCTPCLIDGALFEDKWYYAIGIVKGCSNYTYIPAYEEQNQTTLYIRLPDSKFRTLAVIKTCHYIHPPYLMIGLLYHTQ